MDVWRTLSFRIIIAGLPSPNISVQGSIIHVHTLEKSDKREKKGGAEGWVGLFLVSSSVGRALVDYWGTNPPLEGLFIC